jgi:hypothetical protein
MGDTTRVGPPGISYILVTMLSSKLKTWFFLSYLVLLLNFGPSLHHASIFGLHGHHADRGDSSVESPCCCQGHSFQTRTTPHSVDPLGSFGIPDHDCAFCKFFDEYNVVLGSFESELIESPFSLFISELPNRATAELVPSIARGPPIS